MLFACIDMLCLCINIVLIFDCLFGVVTMIESRWSSIVVDAIGRSSMVVVTATIVDGRARNPRIVDDRGIRAADR